MSKKLRGPHTSVDTGKGGQAVIGNVRSQA
jgi:hypothetical protein